MQKLSDLSMAQLAALATMATTDKAAAEAFRRLTTAETKHRRAVAHSSMRTATRDGVRVEIMKPYHRSIYWRSWRRNETPVALAAPRELTNRDLINEKRAGALKMMAYKGIAH